MVYREIAKYVPEFGELEVEVLANKWYFQKDVKEDFYSKKILFSKKEDKTDYFWNDVEICYREFNGVFDLICVIPSSNVGTYSVTLLSLGKRLQELFGVKFENIIFRRFLPAKKMTECSSAKERLEIHKGTFALTRKLEHYEKKILLLDDTKASGDTKLLCAELLVNAGAEIVKSICLGINTTDQTKSNSPINEAHNEI